MKAISTIARFGRVTSSIRHTRFAHSSQSLSNPDELNRLMGGVMHIVTEFMAKNTDPNTPVTKSRTYDELLSEINFKLGDAGCQSDEEMLETIEKIMEYSTRSGKSLFLDKLYAGSESIGQISEFLLAIINQNCHIYPSSPVACSMEDYLINRVGRMLGYLKPDGIFCPGGSYANLLSVLCAREKYFPHVRTQGWQIGDNPVIISSDHDHYSCATAAQATGIGIHNIVRVPCKNGAMIPEALDEAIEKARNAGKNPFYINAMHGTTVLCQYDDVDKCAEVANRQNLWLHVDGCIGGSLMFSHKHRHKLNGTRDADSYTWNAHKMMGVPLQCTMFLTKDKGYLSKACATGAEYLYHDANPLNHGERTLQCGRRGDALKLWLFWKRYGRSGMEDRVNKAMDTTQMMAKKVNEREDFTLVLEPPGTSVCFWWVPKDLRGTIRSPLMSDDPNVPKIVNEVITRARAIMIQRGNLMIDVAPLSQEDMGKFFRMTVVAPSITEEDLDYILDELASISQISYDEICAENAAEQSG